MIPINKNYEYSNSLRNVKIWLSSIAIAGITGYFGIIKPLINEEKKQREQYRIEQAIQPTVLNYEGTDSVQIQRHKDNKQNNIYIKQKNKLDTPSSNYELTEIVANKNEAYLVGIQTVLTIEKRGHRPQSHPIIEFSNFREISKKYDTYTFISERYRQKYDYYTNILDSLETKLKNRENK